MKGYIASQTSDPVIMELACSYLGICTSLSFGAILFMIYEKMLQSTGWLIATIYRVGIPAIVMQALMSVMTYCINIIFGHLSSSVVTAYGMYYKIQQFVFFAAFGLNNAIIPIVAFNYGMMGKKRIHEGIRFGILYSVLIMAAGAIGLITLGYLFVGANVAFQGIFQALGNSFLSLAVSLTRQIVIALPLACALTRLSNAGDMIWMAFPAAEAGGLIVAIAAMIFVRKGRLKEMNMQLEWE